MKFFLDSAIVEQIQYALEYYDINGVTTNPRHVQASGKPFMAVIGEIAGLFAGTEKKISVEVNPHLTNFDDIIKEAETLAAISPNFIIKLQAQEAAWKAIPYLAKKGIRTNLTLVFSASQALMAMRMGAYFVSPFIGWKEANGEETRSLIEDCVAIRDNYGFDTQIIVAAVRTGHQIADAAVAGADIVTAGLDVFKEAFDHPYTHEGIRRFSNFWDQTSYE